MKLRKLTPKKVSILKRDAEHAQMIRDKGGMGNIRYVFVTPKDLLELLRKYPQP